MLENDNPFALIVSESDQTLNLHSIWEQLQINAFCNAFKSYGVYTAGTVRYYEGERVNKQLDTLKLNNFPV